MTSVALVLLFYRHLQSRTLLGAINLIIPVSFHRFLVAPHSTRGPGGQLRSPPMIITPTALDEGARTWL